MLQEVRMLNATIYRKSDGKVLRTVTCAANTIDKQCVDGEAYIEGHSTATHIRDGVEYVEPSMNKLRYKRTMLLAASDWTQMPDAPLTEVQKVAWRVYRQELRDFPATCDINTPQWPTAPS